MATGEKLNLLSLPPEIREQIYRIILHPDANSHYEADEYLEYDYRAALVLFRINRQIYYESRKVFRDLNTFVRIDTPWPQACQHVNSMGHVPIIMGHAHSSAFEGHSLRVAIQPREDSFMTHDMVYFTVLLEDLHKFTTLWFYDDLSSTGLNTHLELVVELRTPHTPAWEEKRIPKWLQRKMLLPFGSVKGLRRFTISGDVKPLQSVEAEVRALQAEPPKSPEYCLKEATRLKLEGNKMLSEGKYKETLEFYRQSWEAMHIIVKGRERHIHAEQYYMRELREEPYVGKNGQTERLHLRVQLVANTCLVYLKMENYNQVCFWGMRTIHMMRQPTGADEQELPPESEAVMSFPSAPQIGKIYYRTGLAYKELGDKAQARKLLKVAAVYLPHDQTIKQALSDCMIRIL